MADWQRALQQESETLNQYGMTITEIPPDGACLFRSFGHELLKIGKIEEAEGNNTIFFIIGLKK